MPQTAEHYLVINLQHTGAKSPEIVEISAYLIHPLRLEIEAEQFHTFACPTQWSQDVENRLKDNGMKPFAVKQGPPVREAYDKFQRWLQERGIRDRDNVIVVADWPQSFGDILESQGNADVPWWGKKYINLRKEYKEALRLSEPLEKLDFERMHSDSGLAYEGKRNSTWDQAFNFSLLTLHLLRKGCVFHYYEEAKNRSTRD